MDFTAEMQSLAEQLQLSDEIVIKMKLMVEGYASDKCSQETEKLNEQIEALTKELEFVKEQAEEYSASLQESAAEELKLVKESHEEVVKQLHEQANEYATYVFESTLEDLEKYAEYVVEQFVEEHKEGLIKENEYDRMKGAFELVKESFEKSLFTIQPVDSEIEKQLEESKEEYNKIFESYTTIKKDFDKLSKSQIFDSKTKDLAETQKEKVKTLVESINPKSIDEFGKAVDIIVGELETKSKFITEEVQQPAAQQKPKSDRMSTYVSYL